MSYEKYETPRETTGGERLVYWSERQESQAVNVAGQAKHVTGTVDLRSG